MFITINRGHMTTSLFAVCFLFMATFAYRIALHPDLEEWRRQGLVVSAVKTGYKVVALTFDDGPDPKYTTQVLDVLDKNNAKATFFVVGVHAKRYPGVVKDIWLRGHEIGNHGYSHQIKRYNNIDFARSDIQQNEELIISITTVRPRLVRPPGGFLSRDLIAFSMEANFQIVTWTWDADYKDWQARDSSSLASQITENAEPGQIIILHDGGRNRSVMIDALKKALPQLTKQGYRFVTVGELIELRNK